MVKKNRKPSIEVVFDTKYSELYVGLYFTNKCIFRFSFWIHLLRYPLIQICMYTVYVKENLAKLDTNSKLQTDYILIQDVIISNALYPSNCSFSYYSLLLNTFSLEGNVCLTYNHGFVSLLLLCVLIHLLALDNTSDTGKFVAVVSEPRREPRLACLSCRAEQVFALGHCTCSVQIPICWLSRYVEDRL